MTNLSSLPSIDRLLKQEGCCALIDQYGHTAVRDALRHLLDQERERLLVEKDVAANEVDWFIEQCRVVLSSQQALSLKRVFNLSGTVLHTNLGRALLPKGLLAEIDDVVSNPCNLEYDLATGKRGDRDVHIEALICELTGAEAATVVNNNAAAVVLSLAALAADKEVIVSRGELIEIGGAFRMPDIMATAGCHLHEVGTTNRTHLKDYENAINDNTALLMKVHTSNYEVQGFSKTVSEAELVQIGRKHKIPVISDLGSGNLVDFRALGLPDEDTVQKNIEDGVDIITFSGDKLLGAVQAGFIVGKKEFIDVIRKHPLKRALRMDKVILAVLNKILLLYKCPEKLAEQLPTLRLLTRQQGEIEKLVDQMLPVLEKVLADKALVDKQPCSSQIGSGSLPVESLPSMAIRVSPLPDLKHTGTFLKQVTNAFIKLPVPVIGRIKDDAFWLDCRCLEDKQLFLDQLTALEI